MDGCGMKKLRFKEWFMLNEDFYKHQESNSLAVSQALTANTTPFSFSKHLPKTLDGFMGGSEVAGIF